MLSLVSIQFHREKAGEQPASIKLRRDFNNEVELPEWSATKAGGAVDVSPVAYPMNLSRSPAILVTLRREPGDDVEFEIKAEENEPDAGANVIAQAQPAVVKFAQETDLLCEVELELRLRLESVRLHGDVLEWYYRVKGRPEWRHLASTEHKLYVVIDRPAEPWQEKPNVPTQWPWTSVLEYACRWAAGARSRDELAARVTEAFHSLGAAGHHTANPLRYSYDSSPSFAIKSIFYCSDFLESLRGSKGPTCYVNCTDCATIVSTLANILGCDLHQVMLGTGLAHFETNPIRLIGQDRFQPVVFSFHFVAGVGEDGPAFRVWDACLMVDGDKNPTSAPQVGKLGLGERFTLEKDISYLDRLVAPDSRKIVRPQGWIPSGNRQIGDTKTQFFSASEYDISALKEHYSFLQWPEAPLAAMKSQAEFKITDEMLPGWKITASKSRHGLFPGPFTVYRGVSAGSEEGLGIEIGTLQARTVEQARESLLLVLSDFQSPVMELQADPPFGDVLFANEERTTILFSRFNLLVLMRNTQVRLRRMDTLGQSVDQAFQLQSQ